MAAAPAAAARAGAQADAPPGLVGHRPAIVLTAALLGVIQGLTEFLPVSSTAHLLIGARLLRLRAIRVRPAFTVLIQLGSILAVMWLYRAKIARVLRGLPSDPDSRHFVLMILVAFLPAVVAGAAAVRLRRSACSTRLRA